MNTGMIAIPLALVWVASAVGQQAAPIRSGGISGFVYYPDGSPSVGATVSAITECQSYGFNLVQEVKTLSDGSFYVPPFHGADCQRVRLSADKREDLWLETGNNIFYDGSNGTTPIVDEPLFGPPTTTEIRFGNRGGSVSLRVFDVATNQFIWAELEVKRRMPIPGAKFDSMLIATGRDGSPDTLVLPVGEYSISVTQYSCRDTSYFTVNSPKIDFAVEAGKSKSEDISIDVRLIKPEKSYSNPRGKPCRP